MAISYRGAGTLVNDATGTATSLVLPVPAGTAEGDLLLALVTFPPTSTTGEWSPASGWALVPVTNGTNPYHPASSLKGDLYSKIAAAGEGSFTLTRVGNATFVAGIIYGWSGVDPTTPFDITTRMEAPGVNVTSLNPAAVTSVTDGAMSALLTTSVRVAGYPAPWSQLHNAATGLGTEANLSAAQEDFPTAGTMDPGVITLAGTGRSIVLFHNVLRPAGGGPPPAPAQRPSAQMVG